MTDIIQKISYAIESQFPSLYREEGDELIAFVKAYYEFLEETDRYSTKLSRQMFNANDIDDSLNDFLVHFQKKFLVDFPFIAATDKRFMIKHIMDMYSSKGSKRSLELLMRMLFNEEVDVYYPAQDILKPSDSEWYRPRYIEVTKSARTRGFLNREITGSISGAKAFVEGIVTKRVDGKLIDIVYLSNVRGSFRRDERVTSDGNLKNAPKIVGSLTTLTVELGGRNNTVGDIFEVVTPQGKDGLVRVVTTENATGRVDFDIVEGGYGYTSAFVDGTSDFVANTTSVYVSTALLTVNNANQDFIQFENVVQRIERISALSATNINSSYVVGDYLVGKNGAGTAVANGVIISVANTDSNGSIISTASANSIITVQCIGDTTFTDQEMVIVGTATPFTVGEYLEEESEITLQVSDSGTFSVGANVSQIIREAVANTIVAKSIGKVQSANSTVIVLEEAWGSFINGVVLTLDSNPTVTASVDSVSVANSGARAIVTSVTGANVSVRGVYGTYDVSNKVRGDRSRLIATVSSVGTTGAANIYLNGINTSNGAVDTVSNAYATGIIVGQNTSAIGIYGNTSPFYFNASGNFYIETTRENLVSPPRYANSTIIEINRPILGIKTGSSATFKVGLLENTETVTLNTDMVGANNSANVPFIDVMLSGEGSGVGFVDSITINTGGTLYSNGGVVTFTGGGYGSGDPYVVASGLITTNTTGGITTITVGTPGEGYYATPTINLPATSGVVATVTVNMDFGYGFVKLPNADSGTLLVDALTSENFIMGSIASLTRINPGADYNADPFISVYNKYTASYGRGDFFVNLQNVIGTFSVGETLEQIISGTSTAKGKVISWTPAGGGTGVLHVERNAFNIAFQSGYVITGSDSNARGDVIDVISDPASRVLGDNAIVTGNVIAANGIATSVEVVDSGFGYVNGETVELQREGFQFIITATANVISTGVGSGYWRTTTSHLNSEKKIQDNRYYQEYSYDVISNLSINRYEEIVRSVLHVSGNELFGSVSKNTKIDSPLRIANSSIQPVEIVTEYLVTETGTNIITKSGSYLTIRTEGAV
jgi:hypothetical protein